MIYDLMLREQLDLSTSSQANGWFLFGVSSMMSAFNEKYIICQMLFRISSARFISVAIPMSNVLNRGISEKALMEGEDRITNII